MTVINFKPPQSKPVNEPNYEILNGFEDESLMVVNVYGCLNSDSLDKFRKIVEFGTKHHYKQLKINMISYVILDATILGILMLVQQFAKKKDISIEIMNTNKVKKYLNV